MGQQCSVRDLGLQDCSTFTSGDGIFDPRNPTGHYILELNDEFDRERFKKLQVKKLLVSPLVSLARIAMTKCNS